MYHKTNMETFWILEITLDSLISKCYQICSSIMRNALWYLSHMNVLFKCENSNFSSVLLCINYEWIHFLPRFISIELIMMILIIKVGHWIYQISTGNKYICTKFYFLTRLLHFSCTFDILNLLFGLMFWELLNVICCMNLT